MILNRGVYLSRTEFKWTELPQVLFCKNSTPYLQWSQTAKMELFAEIFEGSEHVSANDKTHTHVINLKNLSFDSGAKMFIYFDKCWYGAENWSIRFRECPLKRIYRKSADDWLAAKTLFVWLTEEFLPEILAKVLHLRIWDRWRDAFFAHL